MTRSEHLEWCKKRALEYVDAGQLSDAVASMGSDLTKHPETGCPNVLMALALRNVIDGDAEAVRRWIKGFC